MNEKFLKKIGVAAFILTLTPLEFIDGASSGFCCGPSTGERENSRPKDHLTRSPFLHTAISSPLREIHGCFRFMGGEKKEGVRRSIHMFPRRCSATIDEGSMA